MADEDKLRRVRGQLKAMVENLPQWTSFPERYVREYLTLLNEAVKAGLEDAGDFLIDSGALRRKVIGSSPERGTRYADELYIDKATFMTQVRGMLHYLDERMAAAAPPAPTVASRSYGGVSIS